MLLTPASHRGASNTPMTKSAHRAREPPRDEDPLVGRDNSAPRTSLCLPARHPHERRLQSDLPAMLRDANTYPQRNSTGDAAVLVTINACCIARIAPMWRVP